LSPGLSIILLAAAQLELLPAPLRGEYAVSERSEPRPFRTGVDDGEIYDGSEKILYVWTATVSRTQKEAALERTRAVIASAVYAFDAEKKWSEHPAWTSLNSWRGYLSTVLAPLPHAANTHPLAFADARGGRSPRWDLASFAARYFTGDHATKCRLLAQSRFLSDRLEELGLEAQHPHCAGFERWAELPKIETIEVSLASPTSQAVGSLFGHLFLRIQGTNNRAIAFLAESSGVIEEDPLYPLKGIFGGYRASLFEKSFLDVYRDYVIAESRSIRRFRLNLDETQRRRLMERLYTRLHAAHYTYYFFAQNCATLLIDIFSGISPAADELRVEGSFGRGPSSVLDALAKSSLLTYVPEPYASFEVEAAEAAVERQTIAARLANDAPELAYAFEMAKSSPDAEQRAGAYRRLAEVFIDRRRTSDRDAAEWLRSSARIEAHRSAKESLDAEKILLKTRRELQRETMELIDPPIEAPGGDDEELRFVAYRRAADYLADHEDDAFRLYLLLSADLAGDSIKKRDPELHARLFLPERDRPVLAQRYLSGKTQLFEPIAVTAVSPALLAVQRAKQAIAARRTLPPEETAAKISEEEEHYQNAYERTGIDTFGVSGAYDRATGVIVHGAAFDERLGDQRRHGFPGHTAFTFLRSEALWIMGATLPRVESSRTRFFGYRNVPRGRTFGFELEADLSTRRGDLTPRAGAGVLWAIASSTDFADHLVASTGLAYDAFFPINGRDVHAIEVPVALEVRKSLSGPMHALRLKAVWSPAFDVMRRDLSYRLGAEGELRIQMSGKVALRLRGRWRDGEEVAVDAGVLFD
jgi:hypothetical protein